jgi:hypothetical protein
MSALVSLRDGVAAALAADARLTGVNVSIHGGNFTDVELKDYGKKAPHLVVSLLDTPIETRGGAPVATANMVIVVIENDRKGPAADRHTRALSLADATLRALVRLVLTVPDTTFPKNVRAHNLYSPAWDRNGLASWAITWQQDVKLSESVPVWDGIFATLDTQYDLNPRDNGADLGDVIEAEDTQTLNPFP